MDEERGPGRPPNGAVPLTEEQRAVLGTDRWFTVEDISRILGMRKQTVRDAIARGALAARMVPGFRTAQVKAKGTRVIEWRDRLTGVSDGPEEDFPMAR